MSLILTSLKDRIAKKNDSDMLPNVNLQTVSV